MYIVTAIPLDYIPKEAGETFTFFSAQSLKEGAFIEAPIKTRLFKLLVLKIVPLKEYKASLRKSDFALSPVSKILWDNTFLNNTHYELANYLSSYYRESLGSYLKLMFPIKIWKQLKKAEISLPHPVDGGAKRQAVIMDYWNNVNFDQSLKKLINNHKGQILILCPTLIHLQYLEKELIANNSAIPLLIYRQDLGIKDYLAFYKIFIAFPNAIILGLQSAIFLPFFNLEAIVIYDYRQRGHFSIDQHPYYSTTKVAAMWAKLTNCKLILSAAIPDIELASISKTYLNGLPTFKKQLLEIVDLKTLSSEMKSKIILAPVTLTQVKSFLTLNKRILIFLNRKGLAHYIICRDCGQVPHCPHCQKFLTLRENGAGRELICRECGYKTVVPNTCPHCHSWHLKEVGLGVEAIVKQLKDNFISPLIINLISRDELENNVDLQNLLVKPLPITVATEIIFKPQTKPFDLTVMVNSDSLLNSTNYLAPEELINCIFQLRGLTREKIILQTFEPKNNLWDYWRNESPISFYEEELKNRKEYHYPPFAHIIRITFRHKSNLIGSKRANQLVTCLQEKITKMPTKEKELFKVLGPIPGNYLSKQGVFFWEIIIKLETDNIRFRDNLLQNLPERNINLEIDPPLGI